MSDLLASVPETIEDEFDDVLHTLRLARGQHEKQVDVRTRGERAAAIAAHRHDGNPLFSTACGEQCGVRQVEQASNDLIFREAQRFCAARAFTVVNELPFGHRMRLFERSLQHLHHIGSQVRLGRAALRYGGGELMTQNVGLDQNLGGKGRLHNGRFPSRLFNS